MATSSSSANTNFNDTQQLEQPMDERGNDNEEQVNPTNPTKSFVCRLLGCPRKFPNNAALNFHRRKGHLIHFICGLCMSGHDDWTTTGEFAFLGRDELEQHFRMLHPGFNIRQQFSSADHQRSPSSSGYESTDLQITSSSTTLEEIQKSQINLLQLEVNNVETRLEKKQEELENSLKKNMVLEKKLLKEKSRLGLLEKEVADLKRKIDENEAHNGQNSLEEDRPRNSGTGQNDKFELACKSQQCITSVQKLSQSLFEAEEKLAKEQKAHEERESKLEESIIQWKRKTDQLETKLSELELDKRESDRTLLDKDGRLSYALERVDNLGSELKSSRTKISKLEEALKISNCKANVEREKYKNIKIKLDQIQAMQNKRSPFT